MKASIFTRTLIIALFIYGSTTTANAQFEWAINLGGSGIDDARDMVVDDEGNSYVAGEFNSPDATFGSFMLVGGGNFELADFFVTKYNTNGDAQWAIAFKGNEQVQATGIDLDEEGNVYVTGMFNDSLMIGNMLFTTVLPNSKNGFIAKLDNNGNLIWAQQVTGNVNSIYDIAVHDNGNFYICGAFLGTISHGANSFSVIGVNENTYVAKYNSNGQLLWLDQQPADTSLQNVSEVAISPDGLHIYTAGWFLGTLNLGGGIMVSQLGDQRNPFLASYDSDGNIRWSQRFGAYQLPFLNSDVGINDLTVKSNGDPILLAEFGGGIIFNDVDTVTTAHNIPNATWHYESFLACYDSMGNYQWRSIIIGNDAKAVDMAIDGDDNIYLTGNVDGDIDFGAVQHSQQTGSPFVVKFNGVGVALRSITTDVLGNPNKMEIGVDNDDNVYISGSFFAGASFPPQTTNSTGLGSIYLAKTGISTHVTNTSADLELSIYPNPTKDVAYIELGEVTGEVIINIYSIRGELVLTNHLMVNGGSTTANIDLSILQSGPYYIEVNSKDKRMSELLFIAR